MGPIRAIRVIRGSKSARVCGHENYFSEKCSRGFIITDNLKSRAFCLAILLISFGAGIYAQEELASPAAEKKSYPEIPKEYEVGEDTVSPDGRFAILYEVRDQDSMDDPGLPNLLVRLKPYAVLKEIDNDRGVTWKGGRGAADAKWNGNNWVAVWHRQKWGDEDLAVYEIANDKIKREEKIWPQVVEYFDHDWKARFLKKYPEASDGYVFRADYPDRVTLEFKGQKLLLNIFAENRLNLAPGPHWSAELHATWDLDKAKFEKAHFEPGEISVRPQPEE